MTHPRSSIRFPNSLDICPIRRGEAKGEVGERGVLRVGSSGPTLDKLQVDAGPNRWGNVVVGRSLIST